MAADAARHQWTPPPGRHQVSMGGSMTRFLKQRKGIQPTKQNKAMPTSNFYHFKYNFMPESVDASKPGVLELSTKDVTTVRVERASHQSDEVHVFRGKEEPAKGMECVLIYDPENGTYTLEKLDASLILHHEGRGPPKMRQPSASPLPTVPSPAASMSKAEDDLTAEIFRELESMKEENADDDNDDEIPLSASSRKLATKVPKAAPFRPPVPDASGGKPKPKLRGSTTTDSTAPSKPARPSPLASSLPRPLALTPSSHAPSRTVVTQDPRSPDKGKATRAPAHTIDVEEEELEFGQPARQTKRSRISPQPGVSPTGIALPGASASHGLALPSAGGIVSLPGPATGHSAAGQDEEDDDDEWDEVAGTGVGAGGIPGTNVDDGSIFGDGDVDEGEEINVDQFAAEMDKELLGGLEDEDADGDGDEVFGDVEDPVPVQVLKPMSLNEFAGGGVMGVDDADDDYSSSSEESDDD